MTMLKLRQVYRIDKIYLESGYYAYRQDLEDELIRCDKRENQFIYPRFNAALPDDLHHARIRICSGFWRGQELLLTYFTVKAGTNISCSCNVYQFPHTPGDGKCHN